MSAFGGKADLDHSLDEGPLIATCGHQEQRFIPSSLATARAMAAMVDRVHFLSTDRLHLRCWREDDRVAFAEMNAHPEVMDDLGGPISRIESDQKFDRYVEAFEEYGFSRWVIERHGEFLGYVGVMPRRDEHPLGLHEEIGWRLVKRAWGQGYATEAARAALNDAFSRIGLTEIVSYTSSTNLRSQAVIKRLGLQREPSRDFSIFHNSIGNWQGLVWVWRAPSRPGNAANA